MKDIFRVRRLLGMAWLFAASFQVVAQPVTEDQRDPAFHGPKTSMRYIEILAGGNMSSLGDWCSSGNNPRYGFSGGIGLSLSSGRRFEPAIYLLYESKGYKCSFEGQNNATVPPRTVTARITGALNYITGAAVPRLVFGNRKVLLGAGPYISYLLSAKIDNKHYTGDTLTYSYVYRPDPHSVYPSLQAGLMAIAGYEFEIENVKTCLRLQYSLDLGSAEFEETLVDNIYNSTLSVHAVTRFRFR